MAENTTSYELLFIVIIVIYTFIISLINYSGYYKARTIPDFLINIIQHNLESTPIMDILFDEQCNDDNTSNILGYYYGFESGFVYDKKSYREENRKKICEGKEDECINFLSQPEIPYNKFKGKKLCTSKRPNKNYFDYVKSSRYGICPTGTKICGKLDINRYFCVKVSESCPINDIVFNNQSEYKNYYGMTYTSIKINDKEYLHYTNQFTNNYIITNLTFLGGAGYALPCGANDNNNIYSYSSIENNIFCGGEDNNFKYYFYKALTDVSLEEFYLDNNIDLGYLPEYKNLAELGKMTLYSTGYFSLNEKDIKNFKGSTNPFKKFNKYSKIISRCSLICFITIFIFGAYGVLVITYSFIFGNKEFRLIILIIFLIITLYITICGLFEMKYAGFVFNLTGEFPTYFEVFKKMENPKSKLHFWPFLFFLLFQIYFLLRLGFKDNTKKIIRIYNEDPATLKLNENNDKKELNEKTELPIEPKSKKPDNSNSKDNTSTPTETENLNLKN